MTFDEIVSMPRRFRANRDSGVPRQDAIGLVGKELELVIENAKAGLIYLKELATEDEWIFLRSDVSELTPLSFEGRGIAIGDEVMRDEIFLTVYGFYWSDGEWKLDAVIGNDFEHGCHHFAIASVTAHRAPSDSPPRTVEQVLASLPDADKAVVMRALGK